MRIVVKTEPLPEFLNKFRMISIRNDFFRQRISKGVYLIINVSVGLLPVHKSITNGKISFRLTIINMEEVLIRKKNTRKIFFILFFINFIGAVFTTIIGVGCFFSVAVFICLGRKGLEVRR